MCFKAVDRVGGRAARWDDSAGFLMATEKTIGRQAVDYGNQVAGLRIPGEWGLTVVRAR